MSTKHTAKIITAGSEPYRVYRGYGIKKWDNGNLCDPGLRGSQYSVYEFGQSPATASAFEICETLAEAKEVIDSVIKSNIEI